MRFRPLFILSLSVLLLVSSQAIASSSDAESPIDLDLHSGDELSEIIIDIFTYGGERDPASELRGAVVDLLSAAVNTVDIHDEKIGGKVEIDGIEDVGNGEVYFIGQGKEYHFSDDGVMQVREGGLLRFGTFFTITGESVTVHMDRGSVMEIFGRAYTTTSDTTMILEGSLCSDISATGDLTQGSMNAAFKGTIDLRGTLSVADWNIYGHDGAEVDMDISVTAQLEPGSEITDLRDITESVLDDVNGITMEFDIANLTVDFDTSVMEVESRVIRSDFKLSSPMGSEELVLDGMDVYRTLLDVNFHETRMDSMHFLLEGTSTSDSTIKVSTLEADVKTLQGMLFSCKLDIVNLTMSVGDLISVSMEGGRINFWGDVVADLELKGNARVFFLSMKVYGDFYATSDVYMSGFLMVPIRSGTHCRIEDVADISFVEDEKAHLSIFTDMEYRTTIYPDQGYKLLEMTDPRYVSYELEEIYNEGVPSSLFGTFHVELEIGEYELTLDEDVVMVKAFEMVELPTPEPQEGKTFVGWLDGAVTYKDTYVMPGYSVTLTSVWSDDEYEPNIHSKVYSIQTEEKSINIRKDTMDDIRSLINDGKVDVLQIVTSNGTVEMSKEAVLGTEGALTVTFTSCFHYEVPEYEESVSRGKLYVTWITDRNGIIIEPKGPVRITVLYDGMTEGDNHVDAYTMSVIGRLKTLGCSAEINGDAATVTVSFDSMPFVVLKSSFVPEVEKVSMDTLIIAFIPVVLTGIILAAITRKY